MVRVQIGRRDVLHVDHAVGGQREVGARGAAGVRRAGRRARHVHLPDPADVLERDRGRPGVEAARTAYRRVRLVLDRRVRRREREQRPLRGVVVARPGRRVRTRKRILQRTRAAELRAVEDVVGCRRVVIGIGVTVERRVSAHVQAVVRVHRTVQHRQRRPVDDTAVADAVRPVRVRGSIPFPRVEFAAAHACTGERRVGDLVVGQPEVVEEALAPKSDLHRPDHVAGLPRRREVDDAGRRGGGRVDAVAEELAVVVRAGYRNPRGEGRVPVGWRVAGVVDPVVLVLVEVIEIVVDTGLGRGQRRLVVLVVTRERKLLERLREDRERDQRHQHHDRDRDDHRDPRLVTTAIGSRTETTREELDHGVTSSGCSRRCGRG